MSCLEKVADAIAPSYIDATSFAYPDRTKRLLYVSHDQPQETCSGFCVSISVSFDDNDNPQIKTAMGEEQEPSTIYTQLSICQPSSLVNVSDPGYYPSYCSLSPEQRWKYLDWLQDIRRPINISYVFLYYYGLERRMMSGAFDDAFDEILLLRKHHCTDHSTFDVYSRTSLLAATILLERLDKLPELATFEKNWASLSLDLLLLYRLGRDLDPDTLLAVAMSFRGEINKRYTKTQPGLYLEQLTKALIERYGRPAFPFAAKYSLDDSPRKTRIIFANYSFHYKYKEADFPDMLANPSLQQDLSELFAVVHENVKESIKQRRKRKPQE